MKRLVYWLALICLSAPAVSSTDAAGAEHPLSLNEAIRLALEKNDDLVVVRHTVTAAHAAVSGANGAYDPTLGLDGLWHRTTLPVNSAFSGAPPGSLAAEDEATEAGVSLHQLLPTGGALALRARGSRATTDGVFTLLSPSYGTNLGVELRQPLLRNLAIDPVRLSVRVAKAGLLAADAELRRTVAETVASVEGSYWTLASARLSVNVQEEAVRLAEEQLGETETRVGSGAAPRSELAQPRAELERRRGELLAARESVSREENTLKVLILGEHDETLWTSTFAPTDSVAVTGVTVDVHGSVQRALSSRPEIALADALIQRRHAETAFAKTSVLPSLDAFASYDGLGLAGSRNPAGPAGPVPPQVDGSFPRSWGTLRDGDFRAARVGVELALPIPNRSARADVVIARSAEQQAETELSRVRKTVRAEVLDAAASLETAQQRIEATRASREAAEIQLQAEQDRYQSGLSTNFLVLTRQNQLSRARLDEISALTDYRTARTEMARVTGALIEERGIDTGAGTR
jgi:outer membrane protein TolC